MSISAVTLKILWYKRHWYNGYHGSGMGVEAVSVTKVKHSGGVKNSIEASSKSLWYGYFCGFTVIVAWVVLV